MATKELIIDADVTINGTLTSANSTGTGGSTGTSGDQSGQFKQVTAEQVSAERINAKLFCDSDHTATIGMGRKSPDDGDVRIESKSICDDQPSITPVTFVGYDEGSLQGPSFAQSRARYGLYSYAAGVDETLGYIGFDGEDPAVWYCDHEDFQDWGSDYTISQPYKIITSRGLSDSTSSSSSQTVATSKAVKAAYDKANHSHQYLSNATKYAGSSSAGGPATCVQASITFSNAGDGGASGTWFNGEQDEKVSYNTIGAAAANHSHSAYMQKRHIELSGTTLTITLDN